MGVASQGRQDGRGTRRRTPTSMGVRRMPALGERGSLTCARCLLRGPAGVAGALPEAPMAAGAEPRSHPAHRRDSNLPRDGRHRPIGPGTRGAPPRPRDCPRDRPRPPISRGAARRLRSLRPARPASPAPRLLSISGETGTASAELCVAIDRGVWHGLP